MPIAAMWGTAVGYTEYGSVVDIETADGRVMVISKKTFDSLFYRLDAYTAALKENCIEYVFNGDVDADIFEFPEWYIDAVEDGIIYGDCGMDFFVEDSGEIAMSPSSVILKNHIGDLKHMESDKFFKFYDTVGE